MAPLLEIAVDSEAQWLENRAKRLIPDLSFETFDAKRNDDNVEKMNP